MTGAGLAAMAPKTGSPDLNSQAPGFSERNSTRSQEGGPLAAARAAGQPPVSPQQAGWGRAQFLTGAGGSAFLGQVIVAATEIAGAAREGLQAVQDVSYGVPGSRGWRGADIDLRAAHDRWLRP